MSCPVENRHVLMQQIMMDSLRRDGLTAWCLFTDYEISIHNMPAGKRLCKGI